MATSTPFYFSFLLLLLLLIRSPSCDAQLLKLCRFDAIYQVDDSISDTENLISEKANTPLSRVPNDAPGRCSNGQHMIDYLALDAGLPFVNKDGLMDHGVNYAVAGSSLHHPLDWMYSHFNSINRHNHNQRDGNQKLRNDLLLVGEIEGDVYNHAFFQGNTIEEVKHHMLPNVVQTIKTSVQNVISYGATRIVVLGSVPIGCLPTYLTRFRTTDPTAYDTHHCLKDLNSFATFHNHQLKQAIKALEKENPHAVIVYADYYDAFLSILGHGFVVEEVNKASLQQPCCESGGNHKLKHMCAVPGTSTFSSPKEAISLDGVHLTPNAYKIMATSLIHRIFPKLHCFR